MIKISWRMLRIGTYALALTSGLAGGANAYLNGERAAYGCGLVEIANFVPLEALKESSAMFLPAIIIIGITAFSWERVSCRLASFITAFAFTGIAIYFLIDDVSRNYSPCDVKGDETSVFLLILGFVYLPIAWGGLMAVLEMVGLLIPLAQRLFFRNR